MAFKDFIAVQEGVKAFPWRVELTDAGGPLYSGGAPATYNDYNGGQPQGRIQTPLSQREAPLHMQTYGGSEAVDWLMDALNYVTESASSSLYHFEDAQKQQFAVAKNPSDPSPSKLAPQSLIKLFDSPNPFMSWDDLCTLLLIDWYIVGNAYWVKWQQNAQKQPSALYRMAPQYVRIIPGPYGPAEYRYRLPGQQNETKFTPDQVCHFKRPNPNNPYYGLGVVQGGARALDMEIALTKTAARYYERGTMPSGVVETERRVPRDVFNKLKQQLRSFYGGSQNAGQLMVLEAGLKYTAISPNASQALFVEMGRWSRDRVLALFKLNKSLLGIWDSGDNPNIPQWQQLFDQKTMIPLMGKMSRMVSAALTRPGWGLDVVFEYEQAAQTVTPEQALARTSTLAGLPGVKVHELRASAGLDPSTGDSNIDNQVLNMPGDNMDESGQGGSADAHIQGERGRPPLPENTTGMGVANANRNLARGGRRSRTPITGKKSVDDILFDLETLEKQFDAKASGNPVQVNVTIGNQLGTPPEDLLARDRRTELDSLVASLSNSLAKATHQLERGLLDASEGKAEGTAYQRIKNAAIWGVFKARVRTLLEEAVTKGLNLANIQHATLGLHPSALDYNEKVAAQLDRPEGGVDSIIETFQKQTLAKILPVQRSGGGKDELDKAIREQIASWSTNKADEIALTELTLANNEGTFSIAEANDTDELIVSDGEDYDEPCAEANGQVWTVAQARANSIEHPRCRRAFFPKVR